MLIVKIEILGAVLELPAKQHCQFSPFTSKLGQIGSVAGSSKTATRFLIFSIVLRAEYSFYLKSIATYAPAFLGYSNLVFAKLKCQN